MPLYYKFRDFLKTIILCFFNLPFFRRINSNKVFVSIFDGLKYGDNPAYIIERLKQIRPSIKIIISQADGVDLNVPEYIKKVQTRSLAFIYHMMTARILINSHYWSKYYRKDKRQFLLNTWHGGLGIKKIASDNACLNKQAIGDLKRRIGYSDLMISNSEHLTSIYRNAFGYTGPVWKCGYPKADILFGDRKKPRKELREKLALPENVKLLIYVPTFRPYINNIKFQQENESPYNLNFERLKRNLVQRFGGNWQILVRRHPSMNDKLSAGVYKNSLGTGDFIDVSIIPDIQLLLMGCDACISDYSSTIFDAAELKMPCFTYANDEEYYTKQIGVYYHLSDLPFPLAHNNDELEMCILNFESAKYDNKVFDFFNKTVGLFETGHATEDIAYFLNAVMDNKKMDLNKLPIPFCL